MLEALYIDKRYLLPKLKRNDYGYAYPEQASQIIIELAGFKYNGTKKGYTSRYRHGLNLIRLLWPNDVNLYVKYQSTDGAEVVIWNNYFMDTFKALCENRRVGLTGCASSGKTFAVAVYALLMFFCDPMNTTVMISTTAGSDAERRVWGELKDLHRLAKDNFELGTLIDYLHTITFDPARELQGRKDISERDIRNGITVIPVPPGGEGEKALGKIIGTKNKKVIWVIDEMPNMIENVLRPCRNLEYNIWFQLIGIGNANTKSDPHGLFCAPTDGWETVDKNVDEEWMAGRTKVVFLHGAKSPNFHPAVSRQLTDSEEDKEKLPFPFLSNHVSMEMVAYEAGDGNIKEGEETIDYMRFAIGFWYDDSIAPTILSIPFVREHGADATDITWSHRRLHAVAGFDPAWTAGGDSNELSFGKFGWDIHNEQILEMEPETVTIRIKANDRDSFRKQCAGVVIEECIRRNVEPQDLGIDISGDGGLMLGEIQVQWGELLGSPVRITGISSLEGTDDKDRYHDKVTQLWYQVPRAIATNRVRGFNVKSRYCKDLCARRYESVGKGVVKVESKKIMKKRLSGRSPDCGDSTSYMIEMARKNGFSFEKAEEDDRKVNVRERLPNYFPGAESESEEGGFVSFEDAESEYSLS